MIDNAATCAAQPYARNGAAAAPIVAAYLRSSPKKAKESQESIAQQKEAILAAGYTRVRWYIDENVKGDSPDRPALQRLFTDWENWKYPAIVVYHPDRLARGWLGLKWLHEDMIPRGIRLLPLHGCPPPVDKDGNLELTNYLFFGLTCLMGYYDLMNIRRNTQRGRNRAKEAGRYRGRVTTQDKIKAIACMRQGGKASNIAAALGVKEKTVIRWANENKTN